MAVKRPTYSSKSETMRLTGFVTVTAGGGGAPPCCWLCPQLATKMANAPATARSKPRRVNAIDENLDVTFMDPCRRGQHAYDAQCPPTASRRGHVHLNRQGIKMATDMVHRARRTPRTATAQLPAQDRQPRV